MNRGGQILSDVIKNLKDDEMNCYVCRKKINKLIRLRNAYNRKNVDIYVQKIIDLREYVSRKVVFVETGEDKKKIVRHGGCNPLNYKPSVEDL